MNQNKRNRLIVSFSSVAIFILSWELIGRLIVRDKSVLPTPSDICQSLLFALKEGPLLHDVLLTISEIFLGVLIGTLIGIISALLFVRCPLVEKLSTPLIVVTQIAPKIALAPLFVLWFGLGLASKVWLVTLVTFFPVLLNCLQGLKAQPKEVKELAKILKIRGVKKVLTIDLPSLIPNLLIGIRLGSLAGVTAAVIGEMIGARGGLGYAVIRAQEAAITSDVILNILLLSLIGLLLWEGIGRIVQKFKGQTF